MTALTSSEKTEFKVAVLISGRGSNLEALIRGIESGYVPASISVVLSDKADAGGLRIAQRKGIPTVVVERRAARTADEFNQQLVDQLLPYSPNLIVLAGFMRVLKPVFITAFFHRIINIHPSLLPAFRGLAAQKQALDAGVRFTGCTVHYVTEEVDAGAIISQAVIPILPADNEETLAARILTQEHRLLPEAVKLIAEGRMSINQESGRLAVASAQDVHFAAPTEFLISPRC